MTTRPLSEPLALTVLTASVVALVGGACYAAFVHYTKLELSLWTIAIGAAVGATVRIGTNGQPSVSHRALAAALTYMAATTPHLHQLFSLRMHGAGFTADLSALAIGLMMPLLLLSHDIGQLISLLIIFLGMRTAWRGAGDPVDAS